MKRIVVHFVRFRNGGDYEKLTLPVMVQVFIAFKKSNYFLNYTHFTNIRVNFINMVDCKIKPNT